MVYSFLWSLISLFYLLQLTPVHPTNITLLSFTFIGADLLDGFITINPVYDIVIARLKASDPVLFANFTHIPIRCFRDSYIIGNATGLNAMEFNVGVEEFEASYGIATDCFFRFYYFRPDLFESRSLDQQFTIVTTPSISGAPKDLASLITETPAFLALTMPDSSLADNTVYPTTLNMFGIADEDNTLALAVLAHKFGWTGVNLVCDPHDADFVKWSVFIRGHCEGFGDYIQSVRNKAYRNLLFDRHFISYFGNSFDTDKAVFTGVLDSIRSRRCAVLLLIPPLVRKFMIAAHNQHMTDGSYVFVTYAVQYAPSTDDIFWKAGDNDDEAAVEAFPALLIIQEPSTTDWNGFDQFVHDLHAEYRCRYPNWTFSPNDLAISVPVRVFEWMTVFAENFLTAALSNKTMTDFVSGMTNKTYHLPTRDLFINANAAMELPIFAYRINQNNTFGPYITCDISAVAADFIIGSQTWFGQFLLPREIWPCGYMIKNCSKKVDPEETAIICAVLICLLLVSEVLRRYLSNRFLKSRAETFMIDWSGLRVSA